MIKDHNLHRILIVEDNIGDYLLAKEYLEEIFDNLEVYRCDNFKQVYDFKEKTEINLDVILLDISLPDVNKDVLMEEIINLFPATPIIVLTGYSDFSFATKSISSGASDYLLKDELGSMILYKSIIYSIERKKHILKHAEAEKEYSDLFHLSPQPMLVYNSLTDSFMAVNQATLKHYGYSLDDFRKMKYNDILVSVTNENLQFASSINEIYGNKIVQHITKNGTIISVEIIKNPITYKGENAEIVLINDITDNLKHLEAINLRNKELSEIQWIQSHIVRAPVANIMGLISLIVDDDQKTSDEIKEILKYINKSALDLDDIIRQITSKVNKFRN